METYTITFPYRVKAIQVQQPLGIFYVAVLPANLLLEVAFSDALSATFVEGTQSYVLDGTQRLPQPKRLEPIQAYIDRSDSAFPNAIILAANYRKEDGTIEDDLSERDPDDDRYSDLDGSIPQVDRRWSIEEQANGCHTLVIPTKAKLAAIIDGQHRLFAFTHAQHERRGMQLICSIFLDLPKPFQAQLFATINSTQKPVDKSLTYELFGYNIVEEDEEYWSPDKLAVFLTRRLNTDKDSPLWGRIRIAPRKDEVLTKLGVGKSWTVSTAVIVEGIMRLFTTNPKRDSALLYQGKSKKREHLKDGRLHKSPLRSLYLEGNDLLIYTMVSNYLKACELVFWSKVVDPDSKSFIMKTVGVQALLDILKLIALKAYESKTISVKYFQELLEPAGDIDFSTDPFRNASGSGRSAIKKAILKRMSTST